MALDVTLAVCVAVLCGLMLLVLFEPPISYRVVGPLPESSSLAFLHLVGWITDSAIGSAHTVEVLTDGEAFYESELAAIRAATKSVHVEAFIFHRSKIADRFLAALIEKATAGIAVRVIVDAIGSFPTPDRYFGALRAVGGVVEWYQPVRWYTLKRFNNRTHREIIVVDGNTAFVGGAGIASHWLDPIERERPWRDSMVRVTGGVAAGLQGAFIENWLESNGEVLADPELFPSPRASDGSVPGLVVIGTPSPARSSRARVLFQMLLAASCESVEINSPYFLPDRSASRELMSAVGRGVRVRIITPGSANNHPLARRASRRRYGQLLKAGVEIYEFQPGMIHAKILIVDGVWSVVGSTNFDSRSFDLNDEVNLALMDRIVAQRLQIDFDRDCSLSRRITVEEWENRPWSERALATIGVLLERQE